jgi:hypothetical protein
MDWNWRLAIVGVGLDLGKGSGKGMNFLLGITLQENDERNFRRVSGFNCNWPPSARRVVEYLIGACGLGQVTIVLDRASKHCQALASL